jgi:hypothetical protein
MTNNGREIDSLLEAISQATLSISQYGDLRETFQRIADSARELLSANYAVLATFELGGLSPNFIFSGMDSKRPNRLPIIPKALGCWGRCPQIVRPSVFPS